MNLLRHWRSLRLTLLLTSVSVISAFTAARHSAAGQPAGVATSVMVHPAAVDIRHQRQPHSLQVLGATADGFSLDLRSDAKFAVADAKVATVDDKGWIRPVANGQTQVTVTVAGQTRTVPVKVQLPAAEPAYSFRNEVMPVL